MRFMLRSSNHFNLANMFTMVNVACGLFATYFITQNQYHSAIILIWIGGLFDIFDGKIARKFGLSNEFGVQLDSFADFLSFVLVPTFLIFQVVYASLEGLPMVLAAVGSIYYVISGLRRLIQFNIDADAGEVEKYFNGVPTPLGAVLLWLVYLMSSWLAWEGVLFSMIVVGMMLNSKIKIRHL